MNIFKKLYCRTVHVFLKLASPFLPYRPPRSVSYEQAAKFFREQNKGRILLVTGKNVHGRSILDAIGCACIEMRRRFDLLEAKCNSGVHAEERARPRAVRTPPLRPEQRRDRS